MTTEDDEMIPFAIVCVDHYSQGLPYWAKRCPEDETVPEDDRPVQYFTRLEDALMTAGFRRAAGGWEFGSVGGCPECSKADMILKCGTGRDPDNGYIDEDFWECSACGFQEAIR